ncbi:SPFH domain-containing protein [Bacteriovorax stolpii]|uniref:SPFH domain-containing protein n=1 Tax=Bacteriovorax stolpii TaxID=960 RepID=A0A2K9NPD4_BACTC|nr:SPFH domain-containing protein [Bacteriovorax stolpii]AUN96935.1 SPFH domain-containing protein [Bacteriovorax stolpii]QDK43135.1 SPFH domain-containing protein [Bacteriovorax stolpii]TDP53215.1 regulator of protease activity HflC (stomatin/prohibitin superfamily) [Bacteriovorax stolpii]
MEPLLIVLLIFIAICLFDSLFIVNSQTAAIIERLGKYHVTAHEGLNFKLPFLDRIVIRRNLKIVQQDIEVETKTRDNVFVRTKVSVQYQIIRDKVHDSYYRLSDPIAQIESYIFDVVRSEIPKLSLDDVFVSKDTVALAVKESLEESMDDFGFMIIKTLITDIDPDEKVKQSMNEINAAERLRDAAMAKAEAEKIGIVMQAEAHAESKRLQGLGMANQRKEIASGLKASIEDLKQSGINNEEVLTILLITQHYDALEAMSKNSHSNTIMVPYSSSNVTGMRDQIQEAILTSVNSVKESQHR